MLCSPFLPKSRTVDVLQLAGDGSADKLARRLIYEVRAQEPAQGFARYSLEKLLYSLVPAFSRNTVFKWLCEVGGLQDYIQSLRGMLPALDWATVDSILWERTHVRIGGILWETTQAGKRVDVRRSGPHHIEPDKSPHKNLSPLPLPPPPIPIPPNSQKSPRMRDRNHFLDYLHHLPARPQFTPYFIPRKMPLPPQNDRRSPRHEPPVAYSGVFVYKPTPACSCR